MSAKASGTEAKMSGAIKRIDQSHSAPRITPQTLAPVPVELTMAAAGQAAEQSDLQLHAQADQLASYLQDRQREVERREAKLNARVAHLENELRTARLCVREREHDNSEKELEHQQRIDDLETRLQAFSATELSIEEVHERHNQEFERQEQQLSGRERKLREGQQRLIDEAESLAVSTKRLQRQREELEEASEFEKQQCAREYEASEEEHGKLLSHVEQRNQALDEQADDLAQRTQALDEQGKRLVQQKRELNKHEQQLDERQQTLDKYNEQLEAREHTLEEDEKSLEEFHRQPSMELPDRLERQLKASKQQMDDAEARLAEHLTELSDDRRMFEQERELGEAELNEARHVLAERRKQAEEQDRAQRQNDDARSMDVDRRVAAAEQIKQEAQQTFRSALEMRILVEELWAEVTKSTPPALITQKLSQLRVRFADQFRLDRQDLAQRKTELNELGERLEARSRQMYEQRDELRNWIQGRESQVERQAAQLVKRELELVQETDRFAKSQSEWGSEKRQLQSQLRQLGSELRRATK